MGSGMMLAALATYSAASSAGSSRGAKRTRVAKSLLEPVDAERAPVVALQIPAEQEPVPVGGRERVRLDAPLGLRALGRDVVEADAFVVAAGERERAEQLGIDGADARA